MVICLGRGADLHMAQLMPLPLTISCSSTCRLFYLPGFTFLVPAHPASPGQSPGDRKTVVVVVVVVVVGDGCKCLCQALEKADAARESATAASSKVSAALNTVEQILIQLC